MAVFKVYSDDGGTSWEEVFDSSNITDENYLISPHLKLETNKAGTFEFMLNKGHLQYDGFSEIKTFVWLFRDDKCLFRGRVNDIVTDIFGQRTISCEGDLVVLSDSIQSPNTFIDVQTVGTTKKKKNVKRTSVQTTEMRAEVFFRSVIETHNAQFDDARKQFEIGTVNASKKDEFGKFDLTSYSDTSSVLSSEILGKFGGIIQTRYDRNSSKTYIDWIENYTEQNSQEAKFGVNLLELDEQPPDDKPWSILLPIGKDGLTISGASGSESMSGISRDGIYLKISSAVSKYGKIVHYEKFDDATKADDLLHKAYEYLWVRKKVYPKNITFKAIDLQLLGESNDPLELGDLIRVNAQNTLLINSVLPCIEMELDILNPENNTYTIGSIMPPDPYNKGKETLTSQHSSRSKSTSAKVNYLSDEIDGLQRDVDTLGNNININAENIKAVAKDIAVVAENLTIAAQNIAITANTIDVKAQELTATFEDEIGDAKTKITATKEGIISEFNQKIYGPELDGKAGIVGDYSRKVEESAKGTKDWMHAVLYDGNPDDPQEIAFYNRVIVDSAEGTKEILYGEEKDPENPSGSSAFKAIYNRSVKEFSNTLFGPAGKPDGYEPGKIWSQIKQNSKSITLKVTDDSTRKQSKIEIQRDNVTVSSGNINLDGYVTVTELEADYVKTDDLFATNGYITKLTSGQTTASKIVATRLDAKSNLYIGDSENAANLYYRGSQFSNCYIKVGASNPYRYVLGSLVSGNNTDIDLDHSHSVSVNNSTGIITLGNAVAAGSGGSFRIADTKTYKDGVSAVKVSSVARNTDSRGVAILDTYDSTQKRITAHMKVALTNGNTENALHDVIVSANSAYNDGKNSVTVSSFNQSSSVFPVWSTDKKSVQVTYTVGLSNNTTTNRYADVDTTESYNQGYMDSKNYWQSLVTISEIKRDPDQSDTFNTGDLSTTVHIKAIASNGKSDTKDIKVPGTMARSAGYSSGQGSVYVGSVVCTDSSYDDSDRTMTLLLNIGLNDSDHDGAYLRSTTQTLKVGAGSPYYYALNNHVDNNYVDVSSVVINSDGSADVRLIFKRASWSTGWSGAYNYHLTSNVTDNHS